MSLTWAEPYWDDSRQKHWPPNEDIWPAVVRQTGQRRQPARYAPWLRLTDIEEMEMGCVGGAGNEFPSRRRTVRQFYREFDRVVGASSGRLVRYIYVEYHQTGAVHGWPISRAELRRKGAAI